MRKASVEYPTGPTINNYLAKWSGGILLYIFMVVDVNVMLGNTLINIITQIKVKEGQDFCTILLIKAIEIALE